MSHDIAHHPLLLEQRAFTDFATYLLDAPAEMGTLRDRLERGPRVALDRLLQLTPDEERNLLAASDAGVARAVAPVINALGTTLAIAISQGFITSSNDHQGARAVQSPGWAILHDGQVYSIDAWAAMDLIVLLLTHGIEATPQNLGELYDRIIG